jgi:hypothetical protein
MRILGLRPRRPEEHPVKPRLRSPRRPWSRRPHTLRYDPVYPRFRARFPPIGRTAKQGAPPPGWR